MAARVEGASLGVFSPPTWPPSNVRPVFPPPPPPPPAPPAYHASGAPSYPLSASYVSAMPPPGYVLVPQSALAAPLPSSFGQGCLWGLVQGILAAFIVLLLKRELYFYIPTSIGLL